MEHSQIIKWALAVICGAAAGLLGGFDGLIKLYCTLMLIDYALGCLKGVKNKNFSSSIARWGFVNKVITLSIIAACVLLDEVIGQAGLIRNIAIIWFSLCEGGSILENLVIVGVPFPEGLRDIFIQARKGFSINFTDIVGQLVKNYIPKKQEGENKNEH